MSDAPLSVDTVPVQLGFAWCLVESSMPCSSSWSSSIRMMASSLIVLLIVPRPGPRPGPRPVPFPFPACVTRVCSAGSPCPPAAFVRAFVLQSDAGSIEWMNRFLSLRAPGSFLGGGAAGCCSEPKDAHVPILKTCAMNCQQEWNVAHVDSRRHLGNVVHSVSGHEVRAS